MTDVPLDFLALCDSAKIKLKNDLDVGNIATGNHTMILRESHADDYEYLEQIKQIPGPKSCFELLLKQNDVLKSGCDKLDQILDGGFKTKAITEISGLPGTGKTQICLQLCVMSQLPVLAGGLSGCSIFIDSNFGFSPERYKDIRDRLNVEKEPLDWKTDTEPLVLRASGLKEIISAVQTVRATLENNGSKVKALMLDSFSRPLVFEQTSPILVSSILTELYSIAVDFDIAVILTSQLTSKSSCEKYQNVLQSEYMHYIYKRINLFCVNGSRLRASCSKISDHTTDVKSVEVIL